MPTVAGRRERFVRRARSGQHDLDRAVLVDQYGQDLPIAEAELAGGGPDRDVDAEQPFVSPDRAQSTLGRERNLASAWGREPVVSPLGAVEVGARPPGSSTPTESIAARSSPIIRRPSIMVVEAPRSPTAGGPVKTSGAWDITRVVDGVGKTDADADAGRHVGINRVRDVRGVGDGVNVTVDGSVAGEVTAGAETWVGGLGKGTGIGRSDTGVSVTDGTGTRELELPSGNDQVRVVEHCAVAHLVAPVVFPNLGPPRRGAQLVACDRPQRLATFHDMHVGCFGECRRVRHRHREPCREHQHPARLDVGRVREPLSVGHHGAEVEVEDLVRCGLRPTSIGTCQALCYLVHRVARLHGVEVAVGDHRAAFGHRSRDFRPRRVMRADLTTAA